LLFLAQAAVSDILVRISFTFIITIEFRLIENASSAVQYAVHAFGLWVVGCWSVIRFSDVLQSIFSL
jgi:hypothetical protein